MIQGAYPPGQEPVASIAEDEDVSAGTPLSLLATDPPRRRNYAVVGYPWDVAGDATEDYGVGPPDVPGQPGERTVYLSSHGYTAVPDGAGVEYDVPDHRHFPDVLITPGNLKVSLLSGGDWQSSALPTYGQVKAANPDRRLDHMLRYVWARRRMDLWVAEAEWDGPSWSRFGRFTRALVESVSRDDESITWELRDRRELFARHVNERTFLGLGAALRHDGVDDRVNAGDTCDVGAGDSFFLLARWRVGSVGANQRIVGKKGGDAAANAGYAIRHTASGRVTFLVSDGVDQVFREPTTVVSVGDLVTAVLVVDRGAALMTAYLDGVATAGVSTAAVGSLATSTELFWGSQAGLAQPMAGDLVEVAWGARVPTDEEIAAWVGRPLDPGFDRCLVWPLDEGTGATAFQAHDLAREYLSFDGVDDSLEVALAAPLYDPASPAHSIELLVHDLVPGTFDALWSEGSSAQPPASGPSCSVASGGVTSTDLLYRVRTNAGVVTAKTFAGVWDGAGPRHVIVTDDEGEVRVYVNGVERADSPQSYTPPGAGTVTLDRAAFGALAGSSLGNYFPARLHAARLWRRVLSASEVAALAHASTPADTTGLEVQLRLNETTGTPQDTSGNGRMTTLTGATWGAINGAIIGAAWVGSGEGGSDLRSLRRRRVWGVRRQVEGDWIDAKRAVVEVNFGPVQKIVPWVGGVEGNVPSDPASLIYDGDVADVYSWTPVVGHYVTCNAKGWARFNTLFEGTRLTFDVWGNSEGGYVGTSAEIMQRIVTQDLGLDPFDDVNAFSVGVATLARPGEVGISTARAPVAARSLLDRLAGGIYGWWTMDLRTGRFTLGLVEEPTTYDFEVREDHDEILAGSLRETAAPPPTRRWILSYRPYDVTQRTDETAGTVAEDVRLDLAQPTRHYETATDAAVERDHEDARDAIGETLYDRLEDVREEGLRRQAITRLPRSIWEVGLAQGLFQYRIGMRSRLTANLEKLDDGLLGVLGEIAENQQSGELALKFWTLRFPDDA